MKVWFWTFVLLKILHSAGIAQENALTNASDPAQIFFKDVNLVGHLSRFLPINELSLGNTLMQVNRLSKKAVELQEGPYLSVKAKETHFEVVNVYGILSNIFLNKRMEESFRAYRLNRKIPLSEDLAPRVLLADLANLLYLWDKNFAEDYDLSNFKKGSEIEYHFYLNPKADFRIFTFPETQPKASEKFDENKKFIQKSRSILKKYEDFFKLSPVILSDILIQRRLVYFQSKYFYNRDNYLGDIDGFYLAKGRSLKMEQDFLKEIQELNQKAAVIQKDFQQSINIYDIEKKSFGIPKYSYNGLLDDIEKIQEIRTIQDKFKSAVKQQSQEKNVPNVLIDFKSYSIQMMRLEKRLAKREYELEEKYKKFLSYITAKTPNSYLQIADYKNKLCQLKTCYQDTSGILEQALRTIQESDEKYHEFHSLFENEVSKFLNPPTIADWIKAEELFPKVEELMQMFNTDQTGLNPNRFIPLELLKQQLEEAASVPSSINVATENEHPPKKRHFDQI